MKLQSAIIKEIKIIYQIKTKDDNGFVFQIKSFKNDVFYNGEIAEDVEANIASFYKEYNENLVHEQYCPEYLPYNRGQAVQHCIESCAELLPDQVWKYKKRLK